MVRRRSKPRDDLFALFPDLPRLSPRSREEQIARMRKLLFDTRDRARANVARQVRAAAAVRAKLAARRRQR